MSLLESFALKGIPFFIESYIRGKEIAVSFLGGDILTPIEIVPKGGVYDYKRKYEKGETDYILPPDLNPRVIKKNQNSFKKSDSDESS